MSLFDLATTTIDGTATTVGPTFYEALYWSNLWSSLTTKALTFLWNILFALAVVAVGMLLINCVVIPVLSKFLEKTNVSKTIVQFVSATASGVLKFGLALIFIDMIGITILTIGVFLGAFGLGFGQGLSSMAQNFVSGLMIVSQSMLHIGDWVSIADSSIEGEVVKIGLSHVILKTTSGIHITVPNSTITLAGLMNYNGESKMRVAHEMIIRHNEDIDLVRQMFLAVCAKDDRILAAPMPSVVVTETTLDGHKIKFRCWTTNDRYWEIYFALNEMISKAMIQYGITPQVARRELEIPGVELALRRVAKYHTTSEGSKHNAPPTMPRATSAALSTPHPPSESSFDNNNISTTSRNTSTTSMNTATDISDSTDCIYISVPHVGIYLITSFSVINEKAGKYILSLLTSCFNEKRKSKRSLHFTQLPFAGPRVGMMGAAEEYAPSVMRNVENMADEDEQLQRYRVAQVSSADRHSLRTLQSEWHKMSSDVEQKINEQQDVGGSVPNEILVERLRQKLQSKHSSNRDEILLTAKQNIKDVATKSARRRMRKKPIFRDAEADAAANEERPDDVLL